MTRETRPKATASKIPKPSVRAKPVPKPVVNRARRGSSGGLEDSRLVPRPKKKTSQGRPAGSQNRVGVGVGGGVGVGVGGGGGGGVLTSSALLQIDVRELKRQF